MNKGTVEKGKTGGISKQNRFNSIIAAILIGFGVGGLTSCDLEIPNNNNTKDSMEQSLFTIDPTIKTNFENAINLGNNKQKKFSFNIDANKTHETDNRGNTLLNVDTSINPNNYELFPDSINFDGANSEDTKPEIDKAKKETEEVENSENTIEIYKNILVDYMKISRDLNDYRITKIEMKGDNKIKIHLETNNGLTFYCSYELFKDGKNYCRDYLDSFLELDYTIHIHQIRKKFLVTADLNAIDILDKDIKVYIYNNHGIRIEHFDQIKENETRILNILQPITAIRDKDKPIFAAILSSKLMQNIRYTKHGGHPAIYCNNNEGAYIISIDQSNKGEYGGTIIKMGKSAELQTEETSSSSKIYRFKIENMSTDSEAALLIKLERIVLQNFGKTSKDKFDKVTTTKSHTTANGNIVAGGARFGNNPSIGLGVANANGEVDESGITKNSSSEGTEYFLYTFSGGKLQVNGGDAYSGPTRNRGNYYLDRNN